LPILGGPGAHRQRGGSNPSFAAAGGGSGCTTACTYTGTGTYTLGAANSSILASTGGSTTGTTPAINFAWTQNTASAVDLVKIAMTCTSCASTNLLNLYGGASGTTSEFSVSSGGAVTANGNISGVNIAAGNQLIVGSGGVLAFAGAGFLSSNAAGEIRFGAVGDSATPQAQTTKAQSVGGGCTTACTNTAGPDWTWDGAASTGTGVGGGFIWKTTKAGASGSTVNTFSTAFQISGKGVPVFPGFTVATLPTTPGAGGHAYVTDATSCTLLGALTGGGSTVCPVFYNGSAWVGG